MAARPGGDRGDALAEIAGTISACENGKQWQRALDMFEQMRSQVLQADVITWTATISACKKSKQWQRAFELFDETRSLGPPSALATRASGGSAPWS